MYVKGFRFIGQFMVSYSLAGYTTTFMSKRESLYIALVTLLSEVFSLEFSLRAQTRVNDFLQSLQGDQIPSTYFNM